MKKSKYDECVKERLRSLFDEQGTYHSRDISDLDSARAALSGFGFDENDREMWGEMKPEVTIPVLDAWINQTVAGYTNNPFGLGLKTSGPRDITALRFVFDHIQDSNNLTDLISEEFSNVLGPGYTYLLVGSEIVDPELNLQDVTIKSLDPRKVIVGYSEDPELDDCPILAFYDVMTKDQAMQKYGLEYSDIRGSGRDVLSGFDVIEDSRTQCSVVSVYEKTPEGVMITKIVHNTIVAQTMLALSRIPVVRLYADDCWIEKICHYRGVYQKVIDLWKFANYSMSLAQFRVANAETANWIVDPKSTAQNVDDWESGSDSVTKGANTYDGTKELRPPTQVDKTVGVAELMNAAQTVQAQIKDLLGNPIGEGKQNQTAEEVLARKATSEASVSKYLSNLKRSMKSLGRSILDYIAICYDVPRIINDQQIPPIDTTGVQVTVDGGPLAASQKQKVVQQILLLNDMATKSGIQGYTQKVLPAIINNSDIPQNEKQLLLQAAMPEGQAPLPPQVIQHMEAKDQQLAQMQQALVESQKNVAALQTQLNAMLDDTVNKYRIAVLESQTKITIERMKLAASDMEAQRQIQADYVSQQTELQAEIAKEAMKLRAPMAPVFDKGRFV